MFGRLHSASAVFALGGSSVPLGAMLFLHGGQDERQF